jgi:serine phosphatase RsbU (regulator of sigma subunit)
VNPDDEQFGEKRIIEFVKSKSTTPLPRLIDDLQADIDGFTKGRRQADDLTAVLIRRSG